MCEEEWCIGRSSWVVMLCLVCFVDYNLKS